MVKIDRKVYEEDINNRLVKVLNDKELYSFCLKAYILSNKKTGFEKPEEASEFVLKTLSKNVTLLEKEKTIWQTLGKYIVNSVPLSEYIDVIIKERVKKMYSQIGDFIFDFGTAADFGAGRGDFLRLVSKNKPNLKIEGWDIVNDDPTNKVYIYDGKHIPRRNRHYDQIWQTTVLHHLNNPIEGVKEISRLANKRIILLETMPLNWLGDKKKDMDLTFVADYYYRLLLKSAEPVPGSYHEKEEWINFFEQEGWKCIDSKIFGNDIDFAEFSHARIVLEQ